MHKQEVPLFIEKFCANIALLDLWLPIERECKEMMAARVTDIDRASRMARMRAMCESRRDDWRPLLRIIVDQRAHHCDSSLASPQYDWRALYPCATCCTTRGTLNDLSREVRDFIRTPWRDCAKRAIWWARTMGSGSFVFSFAILIVILARDPRNFTIAQLSAPIKYEPGCSREFAQIRAIGAPLDVARNIMYHAEQCMGVRMRVCIMEQTNYARFLERDINVDALPCAQFDGANVILPGQTISAHGPMSKQDALEVINIWIIKRMLGVPCARKPIIARIVSADNTCALYACECICARGITSTRATLNVMKQPDLRDTFILVCLWHAIMGFAMSVSVGIMLTSDFSDIYCFDEIKASPSGDRVTTYANRAIFDAFMRNDDHEHDKYCATVRGWCARLVQLAREVTDMPEYTFAPCAHTLQACAIRALHVCDVWSTVGA